MDLSGWDLVVASGAAVVAGAVNAMAGGGTLVSFPALVAIGVPAVNANVTNTVSLCPGYLSGAWTVRHDLRPQLAHARVLAVVAGLGGLVGSALLVAIPSDAFTVAVPWLILLSCALLAAQGPVRRFLARHQAAATAPGRPAGAEGIRPTVPLLAATGLAAVYGGFFGAGLGIMLLAVLGIFSSESLTRLNGLKLALSFVINVLAAAFLAFSDRVEWLLVPFMAVGAITGGVLGARLASRIRPEVLRVVIVVFGVAVAVKFWL